MGKSAQIHYTLGCLMRWRGPTPVSALIHAATMVTAGIYMVVRSNVFYSISEVASETVAVVGIATALFACNNWFITKRHQKNSCLLYRVAVRLNVLGLGVGAYSSSVFHVTITRSLKLYYS